MPGDSAASLLLKRVSATDESERMPPEGEPLKPDQIAAIQKWIAQKAEAPANEQPERNPHDHWAFKAPVRPAIPLIEQPSVEQARWQRNPIDAFIASEHRKHGLTPQLQADKRVWLRRVSLDLIGLPPTLEEIDAFLADQSPEAPDKSRTIEVAEGVGSPITITSPKPSWSTSPMPRMHMPSHSPESWP